jgi:hypothetical protein
MRKDENMNRTVGVLFVALLAFAGLAGAADRVVFVEYFTSAG